MKIGLVANTDWYLFGYRKSLATELMKAGHAVVLLSPRGEYAERLLAEDFSWQELSLSRKGANLFREGLTILSFWRAYRRERFNVVHHFTSRAVIYGSIVAKFLSIPIVVNSITGFGSVFASSHGGMHLLKKLVVFLYRWALRDTQVIFQNSFDKKYMIDAGLVHPEHAHLIRGSGVDIASFSSYEPEPPGLPVVLLASRMLWEKGIGEFVEAARILNRSSQVARFLLVGAPDPGNPSSIPESQLKAWSNAGDVTWVGWKDDMPTVIKSASIVCLPTFYGEGLPKVLLEGAAAGRPLVATDIPACREVIQHQINGLLVPPRNVFGLVLALRNLLSDAALRQRMGLVGREMVIADFTTKQINDQTIDLYQSTDAAEMHYN